MSTFTDPPAAPVAPGTAPVRTDRTTFAARADAAWAWLFTVLWVWIPSFITWFTTFKSDMANQVAELNAIGQMAMSYTFDTATADADPGAGKLRLGSATQNTSVVARFDLSDSQGGDQTNFLTSFLTGSPSTTSKGVLRIAHRDTPLTKFLTFNVTAVASPAGYRNVTVALLASSAASPFANGDPLVVSFQRTSDGSTPLTSGAVQATTSGTSKDFTGIPAGVKKITVNLYQVGQAGSSAPIIQLGTSAGIEATGYVCEAARILNGFNPATSQSLVGFHIPTIASGDILTGTITLSLVDAAANKWVASGLVDPLGGNFYMLSGLKALVGTLDRIRLTTTGGASAFSNGSMNILYE